MRIDAIDALDDEGRGNLADLRTAIVGEFVTARAEAN
jgi:hypothetical protein